MAFDHKPRESVRPADYEYGNANLSQGEPFGPEVAEAPIRVRRAAAAAKLRSSLTQATRAIQSTEAWGPGVHTSEILTLHDQVNDLVLFESDPTESGNAD
jgi:hypothetical protein